MPLIPALPRSTPEGQGIPSSAITAFINAVERELDAVHSFMLLRHGHVIAEGCWQPYRQADQHMLFSLSKSFTATAIGLLVAEGRLSVDTPVLDFFPEDTPPNPSANLRVMRVHDLLSMSTGHALDTVQSMTMDPSGIWARGFLAQPVDHTPGMHFVYNSGATYMLSAIVQRITGARMLEYLQSRLLEPLGVDNPRWETSPQGIDVGGWGLMLTTPDIAAFGQLYLQRGTWRGQQVIPASWVDAATAFQISNPNEPNIDWRQGYGYQFWRCRHGAYRGDGAFGQYCLVLPEQDAVLAITSGLGDMQPPLDLVWEHLLPALSHMPLPEDASAHAALTNTLAHLQLPTPQGLPQSPTAAQIAGKRFTLEANSEGITEIRFSSDSAVTQITISNEHGPQQITCGHNHWLRGLAYLSPLNGPMRAMAPPSDVPSPIGASGAWVDAQTFRLKLWWYETPFARLISFHFNGDSLTMTLLNNIGWGPLEETQLHGRLT